MASGIPLKPSAKTHSRRKSRVFTREACEVCREKKARCDGENPCSRCRSRGETCEYQTRSHKTKRSLQAELDELKDAHRQRDAALEALAAPNQTHDVLLQLWSGETLDKIYEKLKSRDSSSPTTSHVSDASSQPVKMEDEWFIRPNQVPQGFLPSLNYSNPAEFNQRGTSHIQEAMNDQDQILMMSSSTQHGNMDTPTFGNMPYGNKNDQFADMTCSPTIPYTMYMDNQNPMLNHNTQSTDNMQPTVDISQANWWPPNNLDSTMERFNVPHPTDSIAWTCPHYSMPFQSRPQTSYSIPSPAPSPMMTESSQSSVTTFREMFRSPAASSVTAMAKSQSSTPPPSKKRRPNAEPRESPAVELKSVDNTKGNWPTSTRSGRKTPDQQETGHDRERHRRASARNWQKQKQQTSDLEATKNLAEARNRELHREYSQVLAQVMEVKIALMSHAECDHPAISGWLQCQAENYVLNKGVSEKSLKNKAGVDRLGLPARPLGETGTTCR